MTTIERYVSLARDIRDLDTMRLAVTALAATPGAAREWPAVLVAINERLRKCRADAGLEPELMAYAADVLAQERQTVGGRVPMTSRIH